MRRKTRIGKDSSGKKARARFPRREPPRFAARTRGGGSYGRYIPGRTGQAGSRRRPKGAEGLDLARTVWQPEEIFFLPESYGETRLLLLTVNPFLVHASWEVTEADLKKSPLPPEREQAMPVLRIYDVTYIHFDGANAHSFFDVEVDLRTRNWYVPLWSPEKSYIAELGLKAPGGSFHPLARSNVAHTPRAWPSDRSAERYVPVGENYRDSRAGSLQEPEQPLAGPVPEAKEEVMPSERGEPVKEEPGAGISPLADAGPEPIPRGEISRPAGVDVPFFGEPEEILQEKLKRAYGDLEKKGVPPPPPREYSPGICPLAGQDLTGACEHRFIFGVSSRTGER
jgi:hypothetical protein